MVFLRPVVVRDAQSVDSLSLDRYELMRSGQKEQQPLASPVLSSVDGAPVLPPAAALKAQPPTAEKPLAPAR